MKDMFYLLNIGVSGIKNLKEEIQLDFYKKTVDRDFDPTKYRVKAIYGENGAGKSAIITAVKIFKDLMLKEQYLSESKTQNFLDEIINKETQRFSFRCEYLAKVENEMYICFYSFELGRGNSGRYEIKHEILKVKNGKYPNDYYKTIFEQKYGELIYVKCSENIRTKIEKATFNLLSTNSFVYLYIIQLKDINLEVMELLAFVILNFTFSVVIKVYLAEEDQHELYFLKKNLYEVYLVDGMLKETKEIINSINDFTGVNERNVSKEYFDEYKEDIKMLTSFIQLFKKNLVSIDIDAKENGEYYICDLNLNYGTYRINKEFESTGVKKLIRLYDCFSAVEKGGIVFVDEMDSNLNDVYLCKLIEYFMYYGKGQLCFTTHNLDPMTVLKENKNSIDFLSSDNKLVSWTSRGNATPEKYYKNGMIEYSPFNIDATDFVGMFGD